MAFRVQDLPKAAQTAFNNPLMTWEVVASRAYDGGIRDHNKLADIAFYHQHRDLIGRALNSSVPNYHKLAQEWKTWLSIVKTMFNSSYASGSSSSSSGTGTSGSAIPSGQDVNAEISDVLREIRPGKFERDTERKDEFDVFIKLLLCELNGIDVDCRYMRFEAQDVLGREDRGYSPVSFLTKRGETNAISRLKKYHDGHRNTMAKSLEEEAYFCFRAMGSNLNQLSRWYQTNSSLGDADIAGFEGIGYLKEITNRITKTNPPSIYYSIAGRIEWEETRGIFGVERTRRFVKPTTVLLPGAVAGIY